MIFFFWKDYQGEYLRQVLYRRENYRSTLLVVQSGSNTFPSRRNLPHFNKYFNYTIGENLPSSIPSVAA
jgi:hypothetical protein